jgi:hypothetical protein
MPDDRGASGRLRPSVLATFMLATVFLRASTAGAELVPAGLDFQVNTYTTDEQYTGAESVARDASGRFVVVWSARDGDSLGVFGQRFDAGGTRLGTEFQVNTYTSGTQGGYRLTVSGAPGGEFAVVWSSIGQDGDSSGVFARAYDGGGAPTGPEFQVNELTTNFQGHAGVAHDASGRFFVTWESNAADSYRRDVSARLFDVTGAPLGSELAIANVATVDENSPSVAASATGEFVVAWNHGRTFDPADVKARVYDSSALPLAGEIVVSADSSLRPVISDVAMDAAGNFIVVWSQDESFFRSPYGRRFDVSGAALGTEFPFDSPASLTMAPDGTFLTLSSGFGRIQARRFDASGTPIGSEFVVNDYVAGDNAAASVAVGAEGSFVVAWTNRQAYAFFFAGADAFARDGSGAGVFARRFCDTSDASCDVCTGFDDSTDDDADAIPNGCDPCTAPFAGQMLEDVRLQLRHSVYGFNTDVRAGAIDASGVPTSSLRPPPGMPLPSNRMRLAGELDLSSTGNAFASLDPSVRGVRVRIETAGGQALVDQVLGGGIFAGEGTRGWTHERNDKVWRFRDRTATPANGFLTVILEDRDALDPGVVRVTVRASAGNYDFRAADLPLRAIVVLGDQTDADAGACTLTSFDAADCRTVRTRAVCRE